jgi:hypothetical protein
VLLEPVQKPCHHGMGWNRIKVWMDE